MINEGGEKEETDQEDKESRQSHEFNEDEDDTKGTGKGQSFVPGGKKYKEVISGSKSINAPMPPNVKEFEYVPVNNDVDQDLEERVGGEANKIHT